MSRTNHETPKFRKRKRANPLGICNCWNCRVGRMGKRDGMIMKLKRKIRIWWNNKEEERGAYTD